MDWPQKYRKRLHYIGPWLTVTDDFGKNKHLNTLACVRPDEIIDYTTSTLVHTVYISDEVCRRCDDYIYSLLHKPLIAW